MNIKPTRSELIKLKRQIILAKGGHKLLKKKRDGLILAFFEVLKESKSVRQELNGNYVVAVENMNIARIIESDLKIKSIALAIQGRPDIRVQAKNIMGVVVPKITPEKAATKDLFDRGYGTLTTSNAVNEATEAYEKVVDNIIIAAEVEITIRRLLEEIEKTKRRVNALEFEIIPRMERIRKFITLRLEEAERETVFRTKKIKGKNKKKELEKIANIAQN
jgi:V/A-type H+-transporting ATPase subunit D